MSEPVTPEGVLYLGELPGTVETPFHDHSVLRRRPLEFNPEQHERSRLVPVLFSFKADISAGGIRTFEMPVQSVGIVGPYELAVMPAADVIVEELRVNHESIIGTPGVPAAHLGAGNGRGRLPLEGPPLLPGMTVFLTLSNPICVAIAVHATLYARRPPKFPSA